MEESDGDNDRDAAVKQSLVALLPSQHDVDLITQNTNAWILQLGDPPGATIKVTDGCSSLDISGVGQLTVPAVGRCLLYLALCIQQLPPNFNVARLQMYDPLSTAKSYSSQVSRRIVFEDDLVCSPEGFGCLILLGMMYINDGVLRKAWMAFRRALDVGRLMGLHRSYLPQARDAISEESVLRRHLWLSAVVGDSYVSVLLGLESGAGNEPFGPNDGWNDPCMDDVANFERKMSLLTNDLTQRNLFRQDDGHVSTGILDEALDKLHSSMPAAWWQFPELRRERSKEAAQQIDRALCHIWFFVLRAFTHQPYIFRATKETRYEYSRATCIDASRSIIHLYLTLLQIENNLLHCRVVDFAAFIAAITLLLLLIHDLHHGRLKSTNLLIHPDIGLIELVITSMNNLAINGSGEPVAKQSVEVLRALLAIYNGSAEASRSLRVTVPYFGTITITCLRPTPAAASSTNIFDSSAYIPVAGTHMIDHATKQQTHEAETLPHYITEENISKPFDMTFSNPLFSGPVESTPAPIKDQISDELVLDSLWDLNFVNWNG